MAALALLPYDPDARTSTGRTALALAAEGEGMTFGTAVVHVVDDEPSVCRVFERVGMMIGISTTSYTTAEEFLAAYNPNRPGCLILDLHLPTMSGLELLTEISNRNWQLPIIIMSGKAIASL